MKNYTFDIVADLSSFDGWTPQQIRTLEEYFIESLQVIIWERYPEAEITARHAPEPARSSARVEIDGELDYAESDEAQDFITCNMDRACELALEKMEKSGYDH